MQFISIDLETTGITDKCQILEIGAVAWELGNGEKGTFCAYPAHTTLVGQEVAFSMNADLMARRLKEGTSNWQTIIKKFAAWRFDLGFTGLMTVAGKNFEAFDSKFLRRFGNFYNANPWHRRVIDVASHYARIGDECLPNLKTCMERAGMDGIVPHTAVEDARIVAQLYENIMPAR